MSVEVEAAKQAAAQLRKIEVDALADYVIRVKRCERELKNAQESYQKLADEIGAGTFDHFGYQRGVCRG